MRLGLVLVLLCSCIKPYDPVDEMTYSQFADTSSAVAAVLEDPGTALLF